MLEMAGFLSSFTQPFLMSVLLGVFASILLTLPILAVLYHRRNRLEFGTVMSVYLAILYVFALAFFTLYPLPDNPAQYCATHNLQPQLNPFEFLVDIRKAGLSALLQIGMNVLFFLPLGFILKRMFQWRWYAIIPVGFAVSLLIETAQLTGIFGIYPCSYRLFDVDDLIWNTVGAIVGMWLAGLWNRIDPPEAVSRAVVTRPGLVRRLVAYAIDSLLVALVSTIVSIPFVSFIQNEGAQQNVVTTITAVVFICAQGILPWLHGGQTLAGRFVNMTFETKQRTGAMRIVFYIVRLAVLYCVTMWAQGGWYLAAIAVLLVFWLVKRCMPYDLIAGADYPAPMMGPATTQVAASLGSRTEKNSQEQSH